MAVEALPEDETLCDLCGRLMIEWHCELMCTNCGFRRDCTDP